MSFSLSSDQLDSKKSALKNMLDTLSRDVKIPQSRQRARLRSLIYLRSFLIATYCARLCFRSYLNFFSYFFEETGLITYPPKSVSKRTTFY